MTAVKAIRPANDEPETVKVDAAALGFSVQVDLGAGRTAVMQTHLPNDCSQVALNQMFTKMNRAGDFCRAHYKIEEEQRTVDLVENEQRQHTEDLDRIDVDYVKQQDEREHALVKAEQARVNFLQAKAGEHAESGRRGTYEPKGNEKTQINAVTRNAEDLRNAIAKAKAEHDITHAKYDELKKRRLELIGRHKAEIARCQATIDAGLKV